MKIAIFYAKTEKPVSDTLADIIKARQCAVVCYQTDTLWDSGVYADPSDYLCKRYRPFGFGIYFFLRNEYRKKSAYPHFAARLYTASGKLPAVRRHVDTRYI